MSCVSVKQDIDKNQLQAKLKELAVEISSDLAALDDEQRKMLLSDFVSDLFLATAERRQKEERRQRQAEGIAAAKARGVRFGRAETPVPENFDALHQAWRGGEMTLQQAAASCGIAKGTFYSIALRREQSGRPTG